MHHMYYNNGILGWLMSIMHMALPIIVILVLFSFFNRRDRYHTGGIHISRTALDLLKERYARGEISRDEFKRMREEVNN